MQNKFFVLFTSLLCFLPAAHADIRITNIEGFSKQVNFVANGDNSTMKIYGGFAGDANAGTCASKNNINTCNNCVVADSSNLDDFRICNETRAYTSLQFRITFLSTSLTPGTNTTPRMEPVLGTTGTASAIGNPSPSVVNQPNVPATITVTWQDLCEAIDDDSITDKSNCAIDNKTQSYRIGFDAAGDGLTTGSDEAATVSITFSNGADYQVTITDPADSTCKGLCDFELTAGDEKVELVSEAIDLVSTGSLSPASVIMYCQADEATDDGFIHISQADICARLPVADGTNITEKKITGLVNGITYFFFAAIEDLAGNVGFFFQPKNTGCPSTNTECRQATPGSVIGILNENSCFIATAAYGSPMESHVATLRQFRGRVLMKSTWGRTFVKFYYAVSPPMARWIAQDPARRQATRMILSPVVWTVSVFMNWSWTLAIALLFGCCLLIFRRKFYKA